MTTATDLTLTYLELVEDAARAPSPYNTQPWLFGLRENAVEVHADRTRALPVNDPLDRELTISCGAAVENLLVSAAHHHLSPGLELLPDDDPDHVATVRLTPAPTYTDERLFYGLRARHTWREPFVDRPVEAAVAAELQAATALDGVWVHRVDGDERAELVGLVVGGDHHQFEDVRWRRELAAWLHPRRAGDGLAVAPAPFGRFVVTHADVGERTARHDAAITESAPLVLVLGTRADDPLCWLRVGQALERLLLTAAVHGLQAGFSNQPVQVPLLRPVLSRLVGHPHPQLVVRLGPVPPHAAPTTRRRQVGALLLPAVPLPREEAP